MRIDDLKRPPQAQTTDRAGQAGEPKNKLATHESQDQVDISHLAETVGSADSRRLEQLRLEVQTGTYKVSAEAVAKSIIKEHLKS